MACRDLPALRHAGEGRALARLGPAADAGTTSRSRNFSFTFFEYSATQAAIVNTLELGVMTACVGAGLVRRAAPT